MKHQRKIILLAIILLGFYLRIYRSIEFDVWYDEAFTGILVGRDWMEMFRLIINDVHPPLYYVLLKFWSIIGGDSLFSLRGFSVFWGVLSIPLVFKLVEELKKRVDFINSNKLELIAAFIWSINPFFVDYSAEARAYSFIMFLVLSTIYFLIKALQKPFQINRYWIGFSFLVSAIFLTHYIAVFSILMFYIFIFAYYSKLENFDISKFLKQIFIITLVPFLSFVAWLPILYSQLIAKGGLGWVPKAEIIFVPRTIYAFLFGVDKHALGIPQVFELSRLISSEAIAIIILSILIISTSYFYIKYKNNINIYFGFFLIAFLLPIFFIIFLGSFNLNFYVERFLSPYAVFFMIFIIMILGFIENLKLKLGIVFVYFLLSIKVFFGASYTDNDFRSVQNYFENNDYSNQIVFSNPLDMIIGKYLFSSKVEKISFLDENFTNSEEAYQSYEGWALIEDESEIVTNLDELDGNTIFIARQDYLDDSLRRKDIGEDFSILY